MPNNTVYFSLCQFNLKPASDTSLLFLFPLLNINPESILIEVQKMQNQKAQKRHPGFDFMLSNINLAGITTFNS